MRTDVEAGGFLAMKRAEADKIGAGPFERNDRANDIHDVIGRTNLLEEMRRYEASHS